MVCPDVKKLVYDIRDFLPLDQIVRVSLPALPVQKGLLRLSQCCEKLEL